MDDCKSIATPLNTKTSLAKLLEKEYTEHSHEMKDILYQEAVGSLMYTMVAIRLDLAFSVSRFTSKPGPMHWMAVKQIMQYVKGTLDMRLYISG